MYIAWCCPGRCADLTNAWLNLIIPLHLCPALPPPSFPPSVLQTTSEGSGWKAICFFEFNNSSVVKLLHDIS